jgi:CHAT domain-containing protein/tetratricopeptide (TPR) repeat protein
LCANPDAAKPVDVQIAACGEIIASPLAKRTDVADAYKLRGEAFYHKKAYSLAIKDLGEAIRLDPNMASAFSRRGDVYADFGTDDKNQAHARADYEKAARLDPASYGAGVPPVIAQPKTQSRSRQPSAAAASAITQDGETRSQVEELDKKAQSLFKEARFVEAEGVFRTALKAATDAFGERDHATLAILNNLAATLDQIGRSVEAEPLIRKSNLLLTQMFGESDPRTLDSLNNLGANLLSQGRFQEAEPLLRRSLKLRTHALGPRDPQVLDSMNALSVALMNMGRSAEAEELLRSTVELQTEILGAHHFDTLTSISNLAVTLIDEERPGEAEPLMRRALEGLRQTVGERDRGSMGLLQNLGVSVQQQGRFAEAEPLFRKALELQAAVLGERHPDSLRTLGQLASAVFAEGKVTEAFSMWEKTLNLQMEVLGERHPETLGTVYDLALSGSILGKGAAVEPLLQHALTLQRDVLGTQHPQMLASAVLLATIRLDMPQPVDALTPARIAVAGWRARQNLGQGGASLEAGAAREAVRAQSIYPLLADAAWRAASATPSLRSSLQMEAYSALQDSMAGAASRALAQAAARNAAEGGGAGLGALARERQRQVELWQDNNVAQTKALARSGDPSSAAVRRGLNAERASIEANIARIDGRLRSEFPDYFVLVRPTPVDLLTTQQLLTPNEAILIVVTTDHGTQLMAITHDGVAWERSQWDSRKVAAAVRRLLWDVGADVAVDKPTAFLWANEGGGGYAYDRKTAYELYQQIVAPVASLLQGKRQLFIATSGALTSLPFGILVTEPPVGADRDPKALRATKWFADAHALTVIPSIQSLQFLRRAAPRNGSSQIAPNFAGYGDPVLEGTALTRGHRSGAGMSASSMFKPANVRSGGTLADTAQLKSLAQLPGTAVELETMRVAMGAPPSSIHVQREASEGALKSADLSNIGILAIATHGVMAGELTGSTEPGLVFTPPLEASAQDDGFLTTSEVAQLKLNADWVILSACNTASGDGSEGAPGLSGLARAFFYAGARNLLVSHWPVRDDVASLITVETIRLERADPTLSRAEALQKAMRAIRNNASHDSASDTWAHPNAWAPFSLIGGAAR